MNGTVEVAGPRWARLDKLKATNMLERLNEEIRRRTNILLNGLDPG